MSSFSNLQPGQFLLYLFCKINGINHAGLLLNRELAGEVGIEPTNAGIKIRCLTAWRLPKIFIPLTYAWDDNLILLLQSLSYHQEFVHRRSVPPTLLQTQQTHNLPNHSLPLL